MLGKEARRLGKVWDPVCFLVSRWPVRDAGSPASFRLGAAADAVVRIKWFPDVRWSKKLGPSIH
jgi:hypothetical protein